jgi:signal transduction histidine kinase
VSRILEPVVRRTFDASVADGVLAVLCGVGALASLFVPTPAPQPRPVDVLGITAAVLVGGPFAVHRRRPYLCLAVTGTAAAVLQLGHYVQPVAWQHGVDIGPVPLAVGLALFLTVLRTGAVHLGWMVGVTLTAASGVCVVADAEDRLGSALSVDLVLVVCAALGALGAARRTVTAQAGERRAALERERDANARAALAEERARIARELHDIVAHNVSLIVVQTMAADRIQDREPQRAHELHAAIEQTGRTTVAELRRLLDVLRTEEDEEAVRTPQPRLADLPQLVESVRRAGLRVSYASTGTARPLPAGAELTVYRVVQEALTNTLKHAGFTDVTVRLDWTADALTVQVIDAGPGGNRPLRPEAPDPGHAGHGLIGMRERALAAGGTLHTGLRPGGGFAVRAELPIDPVAPATDAAETVPPQRMAGQG